MNFEELIGMTFTQVEKSVNDDSNDAVIFTKEDGKRLFLAHQQDCCEGVYIESITGDLEDLVNSPILRAEEAYKHSCDEEDNDGGDTNTWSFYKLATAKGYVDIRFYGSSNGYYSESASLYMDYE